MGEQEAPSRRHILVVEDEQDIADALKLQLSNVGYKVSVMTDGRKALEFIQGMKVESLPELYILDRMLPNTSGIEICRFLRLYQVTKNASILLVTALAGSDHIIEGLDAGADDYVTKPFDMDILMARVRSLLRRHEQLQKKNGVLEEEKTLFILGNLKLDTLQCKTWLNNEKIDLTLSEYKLLFTFLRHPGKVMTRNQLVRCIQDGPVHVTHRTIDTHIFGLRKKLKESSKLIETVRGIGYRVAPSFSGNP